MPIPKPKKGEKEKDFISRCMSAIGGEYDDNKQAVAVCYSTWRDKDKTKGNEMIPLVANLDLSDVKIRTYKKSKYYVAPVVMAVPGVMNDLLYPADELSKYTSAWDGRPLTLFHPKNVNGDFISANSEEVPESVHLGIVRNTRWDDERLKGETWLDIDQARSNRPEVLEYYEGGKSKLEVSTGLWGDVVRVSGEYNGDRYDGIMTNIRPDHLALLPGGEGACNWNDGCGLRANDDCGCGTSGTLIHGLTSEQYGKFREALLANITDVGLRESLQKALDAEGSRNDYNYLVEVDLTKKEFIYEKYTRTTDPWAVQSEGKLYRRGYTMEDGEAKLSDPAVEVVRTVSYKPTVNDQKGATSIMTKTEKIQALIDDPRTRFEAGCADFLNGLNEEQLDRLTPPDNVIVKPTEEPKANLQEVVEKATKDALNVNDKQEERKPPRNAEEWLATQEQMPAEVRDSILEGIALNSLQRTEMVESIIKDPRNTFTNEQLQAKPTSELKALSAFVKPIAEAPPEDKGFFGMRIGITPKTNEENKGPEPLNVPDLTEAFKANLKK